MNTKNNFCTKPPQAGAGKRNSLVMLGVTLLAFSQLAWSLGLGEAQIESFLGQPLEVKIELITRPADDLASVSASLASAADYELIGASRDDVSVPLRFSVENLDGNAYIAISSRLDINNPILRLILEVNWSSGRMLREYTLFLDPPTFSQPAPAPRIESRRTTETQAAPASRAETRGTTETQAAPAPRVEAEPTIEAISGTDEYGPVQSGETLWRIAKNWSAGTGLNINQVMLAIQRQNPQAFSRNNINLLHRGAILRMPQRDDVNSISFAAANSEVTKQSEAFQLRRSTNLASSDVPLLSEESVAIEPDLDEPIESESPPDLATSQLELLPPSEDESLDSTYGFEESDADADDAVSAQALREELSRKEEELINQQQQNTYLEQRLQELESQLTESREGTVEDKNLASLEERLRQERLRDAQTAVPKVVSSPTPEEPWYNRISLWLVGLLVLAAAFAGWFMSRRGGSDTVVSEPRKAPDPLREIKEETKKAAREKAAKEKVAHEEVAQVEATEEKLAEQPEPPDTGEPEGVQAAPAGKKLADEDQEEADVLDEESADPEIQLDLARAYVSMGDKEAARVILEEIIAHGSEQQQAEAVKMKESL